MIDLHIHLLPGVDDGARDLEESVAMRRLAAAEGCRVLVATPHQRIERWWNTDLRKLNDLLAAVVKRLGPEPILTLGGEIRVDRELLDDLDAWPDSGLQPLAGSRYLLLELDRRGPDQDPESLVYEVTVAGWRPILAHPEFITWLANDVGRLRRLVEMGAHLQVTAASLTGDFDAAPRKCACRLVDQGIVDFVATDAHGVDWRPPRLGQARSLIAEIWGEDAATRLTDTNPRAVLEDRPLRDAARGGASATQAHGDSLR